MSDASAPKISSPNGHPNGQMAPVFAAAAAELPPVRVIRSEDLFAGDRVVLIQHAGEQYRLLVTRNDRLILQK